MIFESVQAMAVAVRRKEVSARELVDLHLAQIAKVNPQLNAVVELAHDWPQPADGPLSGVPMTVKGAWDCIGFHNTGGTVGRRDFIATTDAPVIARMRRAGAIPIAVTNLPEFSFAFESDNLISGRTNNPYAFDRSAGGSGGGGAAAIAAGCSPFEVGGDMGGSIRLPCHYCGIAGLKPTLGRVPLSGYFPGPFGPVTLLSTAGPMARFVDDLFPLLRLMAGPDGEDGNCVDAVLRDPSDVDLGRLRIAFHTGNGILAPDAEITQAVSRAAAALANAGLRVEEQRPAGIEECFEIFLGILGADGGAGLHALAAEAGTTELTPLTRGFLEVLEPYACSGAALAHLFVRRDLYRRNIAQFFRKHDALLCPVSAYAALPHGESVRNLAAFSYTIAHNLSGCPGAAVRYGTTAAGLPIGLQIVAAPWREDISLAVASWLEKNGGGFTPPSIAAPGNSHSPSR